LSVEAIGLDLFFGCHCDFERAKPIRMARVSLLLTESYGGHRRELAGIPGKLLVWRANKIGVARDRAIWQRRRRLPLVAAVRREVRARPSVARRHMVRPGTRNSVKLC
jgi:hypothetical protein